MKRRLIFLFLFFISARVFSQSLEGEWQGRFNYDGWLQYSTVHIALSIKETAKDTYEIYSFTRLKLPNGVDTTVICAVNYNRIDERTIKLKESRFVNVDLNAAYLQTMYLNVRVKKGKTMLIGNWKSQDEGVNGTAFTGTISLTKK